MQQRLGLLRRVRLGAVPVLQPLGPGADRQEPVRAHLQPLVQLLQRVVVEDRPRLFVAGVMLAIGVYVATLTTFHFFS